MTAVVDLDRSQPFYEGVVPVQVERDAGDHQLLELTVRILPGVKKTPQGQRVGMLHMEITQDSDLFFLYTLQVSEEEFAELKSEQSLLVDFQAFPPKFVELLEACCTGQTKEGCGKFLAILDLVGLPCFKLVEANQFKQLTHLALRFQPGSDASIKSYLASRLKQSQQALCETRAKLEETENQLDRECENGNSLSREVNNLRNELETCTERLKAEHVEALAKQKEESLKLLSQTQTAAAEQARKQQEQSEQRIKELENQLTELQVEQRALYEAKAMQETEFQQLLSKIGSLEKFSQGESDELAKLRESNRDMSVERFELEKKVSEQQLTLVAVKQQLQDKEQVLSQTQTMLEQTSERRASLEEKVSQYKASNLKLQRKLELTVKEINKGNSAIETLQNEVKHGKERLKTKNVVIRQQEKVIEEKKNLLDDSQNDLTRTKKLYESEKSVTSELRSALQTSRDKLEEAHKMLDSNQNVIAFLNREINEKHLAPRTTMTALRTGTGLHYETALQYELETNRLSEQPDLLPDAVRASGPKMDTARPEEVDPAIYDSPGSSSPPLGGGLDKNEMRGTFNMEDSSIEERPGNVL